MSGCNVLNRHCGCFICVNVRRDLDPESPIQKKDAAETPFEPHRQLRLQTLAPRHETHPAAPLALAVAKCSFVKMAGKAIPCGVVLAQQFCAHPPAAIWLAIGQSVPIPSAIGHPETQVACIPAAQDNPANAGPLASKPITRIETNFVIRIMP